MKRYRQHPPSKIEEFTVNYTEGVREFRQAKLATTDHAAQSHFANAMDHFKELTRVGPPSSLSQHFIVEGGNKIMGYTFVIDALQRMAQIPSPITTWEEAAEFLQIAGKRIKQNMSPEIQEHMRNAMGPFCERNKKLLRDVETRKKAEVREAAENVRRMQQAMEIGQGMTDWSHATMNRGHFSTPTQGAMQHTPSLAAQIPDPISGPVQVYSSSPSMAPLQTWNLINEPMNTTSFPPQTGDSIFAPFVTMNNVFGGFPVQFQSNPEQGEFIFDEIDAGPRFDGAAPPFRPAQRQSQIGQGQGLIRKRRRESQIGQRQAHDPTGQGYRQSSIDERRQQARNGRSYRQQAYTNMDQALQGNPQRREQPPPNTAQHAGYGPPTQQDNLFLDDFMAGQPLALQDHRHALPPIGQEYGQPGQSTYQCPFNMGPHLCPVECGLNTLANDSNKFQQTQLTAVIPLQQFLPRVNEARTAKELEVMLLNRGLGNITGDTILFHSGEYY